MKKKKALQDNPLMDENTALDAFFDPTKGNDRQKTRKTSRRPSRRPQKLIGKPRSFGSETLQKITAELPKDIVTQFNVLVAGKSSRLNVELAEAMKLYLKRAL